MGTPVSNSMTELYTMMRYLQTDLLRECGISHFDEWAADFGTVKTDYELKPESDGKYQLKTRFAQFNNLPELMGMFKEAADIRTADTLDLEKPDAHVHEVVAQPSKIQKRLIKALSKRASKIRDGAVDPKDDNMLCITNDGRKIGLDQRLMQSGCEDNPNSKVNMCVRNVFDIYTKNTDKKSTQMIFCDMSTPKQANRQDRFEIYRPDSKVGFECIRRKVGLGNPGNKSYLGTFDDLKKYVEKNTADIEDKLQDGDIAVFRVPSEDGKSIESRAALYMGGKFSEANSEELLEQIFMSPIEDMPPKTFNVYDDIRDKLIAKGVPEKEIAFIHDYDTAEKKQGLFNQMNSGDVRILLGSTQKCGAGMNAQERMIALHHLDAPLRPSDVEQTKRNIFFEINRALYPAHKLVVNLDFLSFFTVYHFGFVNNDFFNKGVENSGVKLGDKAVILDKINKSIHIFRSSLAVADFFFKFAYLIFKCNLFSFVLGGKLFEVPFGNVSADLIFIKA